jgi:hypothetical protein
MNAPAILPAGIYPRMPMAQYLSLPAVSVVAVLAESCAGA